MVRSDDVLPIVKARDFVFDTGKIDVDIPGELLLADHAGINSQFQPFILQRPNVAENAVARHPQRGGRGRKLHQTVHVVDEVIGCQRNAVVEQPQVQPDVGFLALFPLQIGVARVVEGDARLGAVLRRPKGAQVGKEPDVGVAHDGVAGPNAQIRNRRNVFHEALLRNPPGHRSARKRTAPVGQGQRRKGVVAHRGADEVLAGVVVIEAGKVRIEGVLHQSPTRQLCGERTADQVLLDKKQIRETLTRRVGEPRNAFLVLQTRHEIDVVQVGYFLVVANGILPVPERRRAVALQHDAIGAASVAVAGIEALKIVLG